ncbi:MAG TPA: PQQ-binding-like beta-propeller repeat protein [Stellaceae bacterium]|nr:PQQ-binding-like beta-propeller repeat protein [Stellaceae bacterium]
MATYSPMPQGSVRPRRWVACISAIFVLTLLAAPPSALSATSATLVGSQTIYSPADSNTAGSAEAFRATASASGTVISLSLYVDSASRATSMVLGLYADKGGTPGNLLTQGQLSKPAAGWNTVSVPAANVTGGTVYWIAVLGPAGAGKLIYRDNGSSGTRSEESAQTNLTTLPASWTTGGVWPSSPVSAYASAAASTQPVLSVSPSSLIFTAVQNGSNPSPASLTVSNTGSGALSFTDGANQSWLSVSPSGGTAPQTLQVGASVTGLAAGTYTGTITITATGATGSPASIPVTFTVTSSSPPPPTGSDWPTVDHDPTRTGNATGESVISPSNVSQLALQWSAPVDGKVTAQPIFVSSVLAGGMTRDVVIVATAGNSVYALDAMTGAQIWRRNFGAPDGTGEIPGGFGIAAAPVVDRTSGRVYAVSQDGALRTFSLADGTDAAAALPIITSNVATNKVWGGLNLVGSNLYIATASDGNDTPPWKGRIVRVDVSGTTPTVAGTFYVVPSIPAPDGGGGIWGYGGVAVDPTNGRVYAATSATDSYPTETYQLYAASMIALGANLNLLGYYQPTPPSCQTTQCDWDFGGTPVVYTPPGCPTLLAALKKDGKLYLMKADDLADDPNGTIPPIQVLALNDAYDGPGTGGLYGVPAYWPAGNMLFVTDAGPGVNGINAGVVGLKVNSAPACTLSVAWSLSLPTVGDNQPPSTPTVANGVVFVGTPNGGAVHAYDAASGTELWNSGNAITGGGTFAAPTVAFGTLYVASWNGYGTSDAGTVRAFAIGSGSPPPPPPGTVLLGTQTVESTVDYNSLGTAEAFQATASISGTVGVLSVYVDPSSTGTALVAGLYSDSAGHPGTLIAQGTLAQMTAGTWNNVSISGAIVTAGTPYWLAILGTQSGVLRFRDGTGCTSMESQQTNLTSLPATWVSGQSWPSCPLSAYGATSP